MEKARACATFWPFFVQPNGNQTSTKRQPNDNLGKRRKGKKRKEKLNQGNTRINESS
jgi:hypothetical protein